MFNNVFSKLHTPRHEAGRLSIPGVKHTLGQTAILSAPSQKAASPFSNLNFEPIEFLLVSSSLPTIKQATRSFTQAFSPPYFLLLKSVVIVKLWVFVIVPAMVVMVEFAASSNQSWQRLLWSYFALIKAEALCHAYASPLIALYTE